MEIEMGGEPAHGWRGDGGVKKQIGRCKIEACAHQPLKPKTRQLARQYSFRGRAEMQEMVCDGLRRTTAKLKGQSNSSSGRWRYHPGGIADEQHSGGRPGAHEAAYGNVAGAALDHAGAAETKHRFGSCQKGREVWALPSACRQAYLRDLWAGGHPGEIAGRHVAIDEAVQKSGIDSIERLKFGLDAHEKAVVAAQSETFRDRRLRAIRAEHIACGKIERGNAESMSAAFGAGKSRPIFDAGTGAQRLLRKPAQQVCGVGGQKKASRREQIDMSEARGVEANPVNAPRQLVRYFDLLGRPP